MPRETLTVPPSHDDLLRLPPILGRICAIEEDIRRDLGWSPMPPTLLALGTAEGCLQQVCDNPDISAWLASVTQSVLEKRVLDIETGLDFVEAVVLVLQSADVDGRLLLGALPGGQGVMLERSGDHDAELVWVPEGVEDIGGRVAELFEAVSAVMRAWHS